MSVQAKASAVRLLLFDVDGVLTDGAVLVWAQRAGLSVGFLSARTSGATAQRAAQLGIRIVSQGVAHKADAYEAICRQAGLEDSAVAFMGDDLLDLPVLSRVGLSAAPADAAPEVLA